MGLYAPVGKNNSILDNMLALMGYKVPDHYTPEELEELNKFKNHYPEIIEILDDGEGKLLSSPGILIPNDDYSPGIDYQRGCN